MAWGALFGPRLGGAGYMLAAALLAAAAGFRGRPLAAGATSSPNGSAGGWPAWTAGSAGRACSGVITVRLLPVGGFGLVSYGYGTTGGAAVAVPAGQRARLGPVGLRLRGHRRGGHLAGRHQLARGGPATFGLFATAVIVWRWRRAARADKAAGRHGRRSGQRDVMAVHFGRLSDDFVARGCERISATTPSRSVRSRTDVTWITSHGDAMSRLNRRRSGWSRPGAPCHAPSYSTATRWAGHARSTRARKRPATKTRCCGSGRGNPARTRRTRSSDSGGDSARPSTSPTARANPVAAALGRVLLQLTDEQHIGRQQPVGHDDTVHDARASGRGPSMSAPVT